MKAPQIKTPLPGPKAKAIVERDRQVTAPAYGRVYPLVVKRASGMTVEDVDGNLFLDFMNGWNGNGSEKTLSPSWAEIWTALPAVISTATMAGVPS